MITTDYDMRSAKIDIKNDLSEMMKKCDAICKESRLRYVNDLPKGQVTVPDKFVYSEDDKNEIIKIVEDTRKRITATIDDMYEYTTKNITKAPSQDDINTLNALKMRSSITKDEVDMYLDKYSDNVQVYNIIIDIAREKGVATNMKNHPEIEMAEALKIVTNNINTHLNGFRAGRGEITNLTIAGLCAHLDEAIPDEV